MPPLLCAPAVAAHPAAARLPSLAPPPPPSGRLASKLEGMRCCNPMVLPMVAATTQLTHSVLGALCGTVAGMDAAACAALSPTPSMDSWASTLPYFGSAPPQFMGSPRV